MGKDPTRPSTLTLTLALTLAPYRNQTGSNRAIKKAAPRLHRTRGNFSFADDDSEVQTTLRNFQVENTP